MAARSRLVSCSINLLEAKLNRSQRYTVCSLLAGRTITRQTTKPKTGDEDPSSRVPGRSGSGESVSCCNVPGHETTRLRRGSCRSGHTRGGRRDRGSHPVTAPRGTCTATKVYEKTQTFGTCDRRCRVADHVRRHYCHKTKICVTSWAATVCPRRVFRIFYVISSKVFSRTVATPE